jgi:hypothetical protein
MGNPIFINSPEKPERKKLLEEPQTYAQVAARIESMRTTRRTRNRAEQDYRYSIQNEVPMGFPSINSMAPGENDHPIRALLDRERQETVMREAEATASSIPSVQSQTQELEDIIIRQLRPRTFSLLFGQDRFLHEPSRGNSDILSLETIMGRLRRQLRNSSRSSANDALQRNSRDSLNNSLSRSQSNTNPTSVTSQEPHANPRDQLSGLRRDRMRGDNLLFNSAYYRWTMARTSHGDSDEDAFE